MSRGFCCRDALDLLAEDNDRVSRLLAEGENVEPGRFVPERGSNSVAQAVCLAQDTSGAPIYSPIRGLINDSKQAVVAASRRRDRVVGF
jgi:hypothetical protein